MKKLLIISGPTASGKTSLGFRLAEKFNGEIVSADSRQIYRGMNIVTGKETHEEIKTWLVDIVNPNEQFSVADFYYLAWQAIADIWKRKKLPIVVGGTGFYIKALLDVIGAMGIEPDWERRWELETKPVEDLQQRLQEVNPKRWKSMNESDRRNPRRLIRAIEVSTSSGHPEESAKGGRREDPIRSTEANGILRYAQNDIKILWIGLTSNFKTLYGRINRRVDERLKLGAVDETKKLAKKYEWTFPSMSSVGYRELRGFIEGKISLDEAIKRWKFAEHDYARRQMTWFKKEKRIVWFEITEEDFEQKVEKKVAACYINN